MNAINVPIMLNSNLAVTNANQLTLGGTISESAAGSTLTKTGAGDLVLSGSNTYTGGTTVSNGTLQLGSNSAVGVSSGVTVSSGAVLDLNGQLMDLNASTGLTSTTPLTLAGTGISGGGALINSSATAGGYSGPVAIATGGASIVAGTGNINLTSTSPITGSGNALTLGGAQNGTITGAIGTGTGTVTKSGAGTWTLGGANSYTGGTFVSNGTLVLASSGALNSSSAITVSGGTLDVAANTSGGRTVSNNLILSGGTLLASMDNVGSGGTTGFYNGFVTHTFTAGGTLTLPGTITGASALVVGGGGGGGNAAGHYSAGGGGGQVVNAAGTISIPGGGTAVTVGAGGAAGSNTVGVAGSNSSFLTITGTGGYGATLNAVGGVSGNNNAGGNEGSNAGGGGGGAGGAGATGGNHNAGGVGGSGAVATAVSSLNGVYFGGGGGGTGQGAPTYAQGGLGGGGTNVAGTANTGGGGGGAHAGGSGIVVVQYTYNPTYAAGTVTLGGSIDLQAASILDAYGSGGLVDVLGVIGTSTGSGGLTIASSNNAGGVVRFDSANTYSGATTISAGTLTVGIANAIPSSSAVTIGGASTAGTLSLGSYSDSISSLSFGAGGGTLSMAVQAGDTSAAQLIATGAVALGSNNTLTLTSMPTAAGLYELIQGSGGITGAFQSGNVTGLASGYKLVQLGNDLDAQQEAVIALALGTNASNVHVGSQTVNLLIGNTALANGATLNYTLGGVSGSGTRVAGDTSASYGITGTYTAAAGVNSFNITASDSNAFNSPQSVAFTQTGYRLAAANAISTPVSLGNVHVGGTFGTSALSIQNTAANDGFSGKTGCGSDGDDRLRDRRRLDQSPWGGKHRQHQHHGGPGWQREHRFGRGVERDVDGWVDQRRQRHERAWDDRPDQPNHHGVGQCLFRPERLEHERRRLMGHAGERLRRELGREPGFARPRFRFPERGYGDLRQYGGITAGNSATVSLDGASPSLAAITFNTTGGGGYTIAQGSGGTLTLNGGGSAASVTVTSGTHAISAPITLATDANIAVTNGGDSLTVSGAISDNSGGYGVTKSGAGTLTFSNGANSYGGATNVNEGTLIVSGGISGSTVSVSGGATLAGTGTIAPTASTGAAVTINGTLETTTDATIGTINFTLAGTATLAFGERFDIELQHQGQRHG